MKPGVNGRTLMKIAADLFEEHGYPTQLTKKPGEVLDSGFFHSLGHGVGLEVHEQPYLSRVGDDLVAGRRDRDRAGALPPGLRRRAARGHRDRHGRTASTSSPTTRTSWRRDASARDRDDVPRGAALSAAAGVRRAGERAAGASTTSRSRRSGSARARERLTWFEPFTELYEWEPPYAKWYLGGTLNVCFNCVDRHVEAGRGDKVAYHWEGEPADERRAITYAQLQRDVVRFANALKKLGVGKGTPVAIYMGMVPELPVAMLACTRLGAPHTVVFGGFSADSLSGRMVDMGCEVLITQDEAWRRGSTVPLKRTADEAMSDAPKVRASVVLRRTGNDVPMQDGRDHWWHELEDGVPDDAASCPCEPMDERGSALPHVHERHDREAEGHRAHDGRLPVRRRDDAPLHLRPEGRRPTSTGARPTSAGSPGTATSSTGRSATARRRCSTRERRTSRTRTAGGRSSSATA